MVCYTSSNSVGRCRPTLSDEFIFEMSTENRQKVTSYLVTKHSWKGKYKRILEISDLFISTYNPQTLELTNQWPFKVVCSIKATPRVGSLPIEFSIHLNLKGKIDTIRFSSDFTTDILTCALIHSDQFLDPPPVRKKFVSYKYHYSQNRIPCILQLSESSLQQLDFDSNILIAEYFFQNMIEICRVSDTPGAFYVSYSIYKRLHFFICDHIEDLLLNLCHISSENLAVHMSVKNDVIFTLNHFLINRFGKFGSDICITSLVEFQVYKFSPRHNQPSKRLFCLSEKCIVERDIGSYRIITLRPLESIHCLVKCGENCQNFVVEYITGEQRIYSCAERDNLLVSLLESVKSSGNVNAHVKSRITDRKLRILPFCNDLDEENESQIAKLLCSSATNLEQFRICLERFNANIPYSGLMYSVSQEGLFTENKEKLIVACLSTVLDFDPTQNSTVWESIFLVLRRLFASKAGFQAFTSVPGLREKLGHKVIQSLKLNQEAVTYAALDCLNCLMQPMHNNYDLKFEQSNKTSLLSSPKFLEYLLDVFCDHVNHGTGALQITNMLDFLTFALCEPYSETTLGEQFDKVLDLVADRGQIFMKLFENSTNSILKGAGLIMKSLIEESNPSVSRNLQEMALSEGAVLRHLRSALFTQSSDLRFLTNRQLSRRLIGLWAAENPSTLDLLRQVLPYGLINCLFSTERAPETFNDDLLHVRDNLNMADQQFNQKADNLQKKLENQLDQFLQHWRLKQDLNFLRNKNKNQRPITLRRRRQRVKVQVYNWKLFYYTFYKDFNRPDLIWNHKTRQELKEALDKEIRALDTDKELAGTLPTAWNFLEYEVLDELSLKILIGFPRINLQVNYPSLINEIKVGDYYLRLLLEEDKSGVNPIPLSDSKNFFLQIYHHFLLTNIIEMKCLCLKALTLVYIRCWQEIGYFADVKCIMMMLEQVKNFIRGVGQVAMCVLGTKTLDYGERDNLIAFLDALCANKDNVKEMIKYQNFKYLIDIACLLHMCPSTHKVRVPNQSNLIEASPDSQFGRDVQEWYFSDKNKERSGPYSFQEMKEFYQKEEINEKTKCWARGMDQWRPMNHISQFRWHVLASGRPTLPPEETTTMILNMLIKICRFYPPSVLPHLVQLFLTFDPVIVEKVATLLLLIVEDNVAVSRLYLTGAFYFILMYTGSNVLPIAKCLHYAHNKQAYRSEK
uniref:Uncharacterized protein n=1 Tax=Romanomermis culicivorax TaxID=13658 RepID=A0A915KDM6_ROMCU